MLERHQEKPACSFCNGSSMEKIIDFGDVALAGAFLTSEQFSDEATYPLRLYFCNDCYALQLTDKIDAGILFKNYFYFSSAIRTLREHFMDYATEVASRFLSPKSATVLEIGCNDGILLKPLADQGIRTVIGVDPAANVVQTINDPRITIINDFFSERVAEKVVATHGKVDMVVGNNVYAHIPDIQGVTRAICNVLADDGVFIFEVHYVGKIINGMQYDMIYHEHMYYYSLLALMKHFQRYDMMVFDVKPIQIHAGSMRYYVCKKGSKHGANVSTRVTQLEKEELASGFHQAQTYARFAADVADRKEKLMKLLGRLKEKGRTVAGYGASGRANTMIQYCGINHAHMDYMIDDAPAKSGFYTPGSHFLICPNSALKESPPDYVVLFAWSFFSEIAQKCTEYLDKGGRMIVPLPNVQVVMHPTHDESL